MVLSTDTLISDIPEENPAPAAGAGMGGGMPGMGMM
jgi:chaperonin GroEL